MSSTDAPKDQYWTNRGYAVLSVNYRGSSGFGKSFIKAAYGEYAGKIHDDLKESSAQILEGTVE